MTMTFNFKITKSFAWIVFLTILLPVKAQVIDNANITNAISTHPLSLLTSQATKYEDLPSMIVSMIFLGITALEYLLYFVLYLYVFMFSILHSTTIPRAIFSLILLFLFIVVRSILSPIILNAAPHQWRPPIPSIINDISMYMFIITCFTSALLTMVAVLYIMIKYGTKGAKLKEGIINKPTGEVPMVIIMMPIYNEEPIPLFRAVESAIRSDYPKERMHLFLGFDDDTESTLYLSLMKKLRVLNKEVYNQFTSILESEGLDEMEQVDLFPPRFELMVEGVRLTICRFPHGGKSATQGKAFKIVNELYGKDTTKTDQTLLLYIDSDIILHENALYNFVSVMVNKPKMLALTGIITCRTSDNFNMLQFLQDVEYLDGQLFGRGLETILGSVTCLPGALTCLRLSAMQKVAPSYFRDFDMTKAIHFHRFYLGEDRFMTHLLMEINKNSYSIAICGASRCKTDAPDNWTMLIKQRRRWYLAFIISEISMLTTPKFWRTLPLLMIVKFFDFTAVTLNWLTFVYIISAVKGAVPLWTLALILPLLVLKFFILATNAGIMNRLKIILYFPIYFFALPIFKLFVTIYSLYAWDTRSWGGPRADQGIDLTKPEHPLTKVDELMVSKTQTSFIKNRVMKHIKLNARNVNKNLIHQANLSDPNHVTSPKFIDSRASEAFNNNLKLLIPFPYKVDVLGGGAYFTELIYPETLQYYLHNNQLEMYEENEWDSDNPTHFNTSNHSPVSSYSSSINSPNRATIDTKYMYGKYYQTHHLSASSSSLDLKSLAKVEKLTYSPSPTKLYMSTPTSPASSLSSSPNPSASSPSEF